MSIGIDGARPWRATVERFEASPGRAYSAGNGVSPWQALIAKAPGAPMIAPDAAAQPFADSPAIANPWRATVVRAGTDSGTAARDPAPTHPAARPWQAIVTRAADPDAAAPAPLARADAPQPPLDPAFDIERWRPKVEPTFSRPHETTPTEPERRESDDPDGIETARKEGETEKEPTTLFAGKDGPTFDDFLDIINPLQHIPIISSIYRELTGDRISPGARVIGDGLIFGPIGAAFAVANVVLSEISGRDVGEHVIALLKDAPGDIPATAVAEKSDKNLAPAAAAASDPAAGEKVLAELLPPGAVPIAGNQVDFAAAALRPSAFSQAPMAPSPTRMPEVPNTGASAYAALLESAQRRPEPRIDAATPAAVAVAAPAAKPMTGPMPAAANYAGRAHAPDPMNQLAAKRTPGQVAATAAVPGANQTAVNGGWFSDVMLNALSKYEIQNRRNGGAADGPAAVNAVH